MSEVPKPWQRHPDFRDPGKDKNKLPEIVPVPGEALGHVTPYASDDWHLIERLQGTDMGLARLTMRCHGVIGASKTSEGTPCRATAEAVIRMRVYDRHVKYLCDDCRFHRGFAWASTVTQDEFIQYQIVRKYEDDTLLRRLDQSPNYKEAQHTPIAKIPNPLGGE